MSDIDKTIERVKELNSKLEKNTNNLNLNKFERASANAIMPIIADLKLTKQEVLALEDISSAQEAELTKANRRIVELESTLQKVSSRLPRFENEIDNPDIGASEFE